MRRLAAAVFGIALACPWLASAAPRVEGAEPLVHAELPGKPTGPIAVEHRLAAEPAVGVPLEIEVTAKVSGMAPVLRIEATASAPRQSLLTPPVLESVADGVYSWKLSVVPLAADAGYLTVIVSGQIEGVAQARSITIPLRSEDEAPVVSPGAAAGEGETLIPLPVRESP